MAISNECLYRSKKHSFGVAAAGLKIPQHCANIAKVMNIAKLNNSISWLMTFSTHGYAVPHLWSEIAASFVRSWCYH
jgi:hypothetical protein